MDMGTKEALEWSHCQVLRDPDPAVNDGGVSWVEQMYCLRSPNPLSTLLTTTRTFLEYIRVDFQKICSLPRPTSRQWQ